MSKDMPEYNIDKIYKLLIAAFTDRTLRRFCRRHPRFHPILARFGPGHGLDDMVDEVVEYCENNVLLHELLVAVAQENPRQYSRFYPDLGKSAPPPPSGPNGNGLKFPWRIRWPLILGLALVVVIAGIGLWQWLGPRPDDGSHATKTPEAPTPTSTLETPTPTETPETPTPTKTPEAPTSTSKLETLTPTETPEIPTSTSTPETPTPAETPETAVPSCHLVVEGLFSSLWERHQDQLGCPLYPEPRGIYCAEQAFERGRMFWRQDNDHTYAVYEGGSKAGTYESFPPWDGEDYPCLYSPPEGMFLPARGFGWVWCTQLEDPIITIGWGLAGELGYGPGNGDPLVQEFERGFIFRDSAGGTSLMAYIFLADGSVQQEHY